MADAKIKERAELGKELLDSQRATGEPGTKQPEHKTGLEDVQGAVETLYDLEEELGAPPKESSAKRSQETGNPNETPPHERPVSQVSTASRLPYDTAVGHIAAARTALETGATADARLLSDPRYERDQKIFELAQQGRLGNVPPSEATLALRGAQFGATPEVTEAMPKSTEEQAADDMQRLEQAEKAAEEGLNPNVTTSTNGEEKKDKNNDEEIL